MAHANEELLRSTTDSLNKGDMDAFLAAHTPDVKFHVLGKGPLAGDHEGREGMGAIFGKMMGLLDGPPTAEIHDCLANDEHGVLLVVQHLARGGKTMDAPLTIVFHFRDAMVSEVWLASRDQYATDAFFA
jgi:ketosteroid isomerase-like protein